jgi:YspA, cpYpsA-related SLOG family
MSNLIHASNYRLIIAGGRDFNDVEQLNHTLRSWEYRTDVSVVCGKAAGADTLGEQWALRHNMPVKYFPAEWDKYGRSAGYRRNSDMAAFSTHLCAFWDGQSRGTKHMIDLATKAGLIVHVAHYEGANFRRGK